MMRCRVTTFKLRVSAPVLNVYLCNPTHQIFQLVFVKYLKRGITVAMETSRNVNSPRKVLGYKMSKRRVLRMTINLLLSSAVVLRR